MTRPPVIRPMTRRAEHRPAPNRPTLRALAGALVLGLGLSACTLPVYLTPEEVDAVRALPNAGGAFDQALQAGYADLAAEELAEFDWIDAGVFLERARSAAAGDRPPPEPVEDRAVPAETVEALVEARTALVSALNRGGRVLAPQPAGDAQTLFDCWLQEQEEAIAAQAAELQACRDAFFVQLAAVEAALDADVVALLSDLDGGVGRVAVIPRAAAGGAAAAVTLDQPNLATTVPGPGAVPEPPFDLSDRDIDEIWATTLAAQPIPPERFQLYFDSGGTTLTPESEALVPEIAADGARRPVFEIEVLGHTDRVGGAAANARLSARRAEAVRDLLVARGFPAEAITVRGFGESLPLVPTDDNVAEPLNRRVEVIVR